MTPKERASLVVREFETYAYLPDIEPMIVEAIEQAEKDMQAQCAKEAEEMAHVNRELAKQPQVAVFVAMFNGQANVAEAIARAIRDLAPDR